MPLLLLLNGFLPAPAAEVFGIFFCGHDPSPCPEASLVSTCHDIPPSSAKKGRKGGSLNSGFCVRQSCLRHSVERAIILDERQRFCGPSPSLLPWGTNKGLRRSSPPSFGQRQKIAAQSRAFTPYLSDIECMTRTIFHRGSVAELESQVSLGKISKLPFLSRFCPVQQHSLLFTA